MNNFGYYLKILIKKHNLTQKDIYIYTGVDPKTIRNIINGKTIPRYYTLELLSNLLGENLIEIYLILNNNTYYSIKELNYCLENDLSNQNFSNLNLPFNKIIGRASFSITQIQYCLYFEIIHLYRIQEFGMCLFNITNLLSLNHDNYNINEYENYIYSPIELRLLNIYGLILYCFQRYNKYLDVMKFIAQYVYTHSNCTNLLLKKAFYNLSVAHFRLKNYGISKKIIKKVLDMVLYEKDVKLVVYCYYHLFLIYSKVNKNKSFYLLKKSLDLCEIMKFYDLKKSIIDHILKYNYELYLKIVKDFR